MNAARSHPRSVRWPGDRKTNDMKIKLVLALVIFALTGPSVLKAAPQSTAFTYQGRLSAAGTAASGSFEMTFTLYDAMTNGSAIGSAQTNAPLAVSNGLFTALLDFGATAFLGDARWLEIAVKPFGSNVAPAILHPRQPITSTPYALQAANAANLMSFTTGPLDIKANGQRALRLELGTFNPQISGAPNTTGGSSVNSASPFSSGVTIAGGGTQNFFGQPAPNIAESDFTSIGGGMSNHIFNLAFGAVIAGGMQNTIFYEGMHSTIGGGFANTIDDDAGTATIGGGRENRVTSDGGTISGGWGNTAAAYATVGGGGWNTSEAAFTVLGGGTLNRISSGGDYATIGGGQANWANYLGAVIGGGSWNTNGGDHGTISGGRYNFIDSDADFATISGGQSNRILSDAKHSFIGGGLRNTMTSDADYSFIGAGLNNTNLGYACTLLGGQNSVVNGEFNMCPGGSNNFAEGNYSLVAGRNAYDGGWSGCFVWADASPFRFKATDQNQFSARATGGVRFITAIDTNGSNIAGVSLVSGSGTWSSLSDRNAKENFTRTDSRAVLEKVAALPLATWNYKSQDKSVRHLGPMAQDFYDAFQVGEDERHITTVDADGVALAAIQGLNQKLEERLKTKDAEIEQLRSSVEELKRLVLKSTAQTKE